MKKKFLAVILAAFMLLPMTLMSSFAAANTQTSVPVQLSKWVLDEPNNTLYAISTASKSILCINAETLNVEKVISLEGSPSDIDFCNDRIYVPLYDKNKIVVLNTNTNTIEASLSTITSPYQIAVDLGSQPKMLYYVQKDQPYSLRCCYLTSDLEISSEVTIGFIGNIYAPNIAINSENHDLYIGESGGTTGTLTDLNTTTGKVVKSNNISNPDRSTLFDGSYVYYSGKSFDKNDITKMIYDFGGSNVQFAKNNIVITGGINDCNYSCFVKNSNTFTKLYDFSTGSTNSLFELSSKNVLYIFDSFNNIISKKTILTPIISGVEDGKDYFNPVTITFDKGTALLDGNAFTSGSTVSTLGTHTLVVTYEGVESTVNFTINTPADNNTEVKFNDNNLKQALFDNGVDTNNDGIITCGEMRAVESLYLSERNISDLTGLEYAKNLENLDLTENNISNIAPLKNLTKITGLGMDYNKISDISPLSGLVNLTFLRITDNNISDISALSGMTNLTDLYLYNNKISDISPLTGLTNLQHLFLNNNNIVSTYALKDLANLTRVNLSNNKIDSIHMTGFDNKPILEELDLSYNQISSTNGISNCTYLKQLNMSNNLLTDINSLENLTNLTNLDISNNKFSDINVLASLTNLESLGLSNDNISSISTLSNLTKLTSLDVSNNLLTDISDIRNLTNLLTLSLSNNKITDISVLENSPNMNTLDLSGNKIADFTPLQSLSKVVQLKLSNTGLTDLSVISGLTALGCLDISDNAIVNFTPLQNFTDMQTLNVSNTGMTDLSPISNLTRLENLNLSKNNITDISALINLQGLFFLDMSDNQISDISALKDKLCLGNLDLSGNLISDISALGNNESIYTLDLSDNKIEDISPINNLISVNLDLSKNYLNISEGSDDMAVINNIQSKYEGTKIIYSPQKSLAVITINDYNTNPTNKDITVTASADMGTLNTTSHTFTENGSFDFVATDKNGNTTTKTVTITNIDKTPPVITLNYNTAYTYGSVTVTATTNEGTLNKTSYTFTKNGSFDFIATDAAGNKTTKTVTIKNIVVYGDVNSDGKANFDDSIMLNNYLLGCTNLTGAGAFAADINSDGKITLIDLILLNNYLITGCICK